ncbi:MAG: pitrilysin family protein [Pseudomonadota bacterium]
MISTLVFSLLGGAPWGADGAASFPAPSQMPLPSWVNVDGIETVLAEKHDTPLVTLAIAFPSGAYFDPPGKSGLANFVGDMLLRGTKTRTRAQIEEELDYLGASLGTDVGFQSFAMQGQVLSQNLVKLVELIADVLQNPSFPPEEIEKLRSEDISQLYLKLEDDATLARIHFMRAVYKGHPYANDLDGTIKSLKSITREDVLAFYRAHIEKKGLIAGGAGDLTRAALTDIVRKLVAGLPEGSSEKKRIPFKGAVHGREIILVDKPDRTQAQFLIGEPSIDANDPDFFPMVVFLTAFGGHMFQAQYMQEIRVKRGWSYGAYASLDARRDGGSAFLYTFPATKDTIPALKLSLELLDQAVSGDGLKDDAFEFAKNYLARSYPFMVDTPERVLSQVLTNRFLGRSDDYLQNYISRIRAVTPKMARSAARKHLETKNLVISILCTAKDFKDKIGKELNAKKVTVVPYNDL